MAIDPTVGQPVIGTPDPVATVAPSVVPPAGMQVPLPQAGTPQTIATDLVAILPDVLAAIEDPAGLRKSGLAILTAIVGVLASVGLIPSATDTVIVSTAAIVLPAIFMIVTAIHGHSTATIQAAVVRAKGQ